MYKNTSILLLAFTAYAFYLSSGEESRKTFFTELSDDPNKEGKMSMMFHKTFHQCSIANDCNFVTKNIKTNGLKKILKEDDLPVDRKNYKIWKKQEIVKADGQTDRRTYPERAFSSCKEAKANGSMESGIFSLKSGSGSTYRAYCDMITNGGGWTVIQRRVGKNVSFDRDWNDYLAGFGNLDGSFWLGLKAIRHLSRGNSRTTLRIELKYGNSGEGYVEYQDFKVSSKQQNYKLKYGAFTGNLSDALAKRQMKDSPFSTRDKDNTEKNSSNPSCVKWRGASWHSKDSCSAWLNGLFPGQSSNAYEIMNWDSTMTADIRRTEMKLRDEDSYLEKN